MTNKEVSTIKQTSRPHRPVSRVNRPKRSPIVQYFSQLPSNRQLLWCYLIWYLTMASCYFRASVSLWLSSLGLALIVGYALVLSTGGRLRQRLRKQWWETSRLFMCPFLVSSFTALTADQGFYLIFSERAEDNSLAAGLCGLFLLFIRMVKRQPIG